MIIAGIDPGKSGAIAILEVDSTRHPVVLPVGPNPCLCLCPTIKVGKKNEYDLNAMRTLLQGVNEVWIEKVHAMPKQGVTSMFSFGKGYGLWLGLIAGLWIQVNEVAPQTWKKYWLKDMKKDKNAAILRVQQLFPRIDLYPNARSRKPSVALAEATLIAMYGARVRR